MPEYAIRFRIPSEHIISIKEIECESDAAAIAESLYLDVPTIQKGFELWQGDRFITAFPLRKDKVADKPG